MRTILPIFLLILGGLLQPACKGKAENTNTPALPIDYSQQLTPPPGTAPSNISVEDLHCWVEQGNFYVIGICNNLDNFWGRMWLKMTPLNAAGHPLALKPGVESTFPVFSSAVPPRGRSSFFAAWSVQSFEEIPDSCTISSAGTLGCNPGAILIAEQISGIKMFVRDSGEADSRENQWLATIKIHNPLEIFAARPQIELLLYGTDNRLWMSYILNPEDPAQMAILKVDQPGPIPPAEHRTFSSYIFYEGLPKKLQEIRIGRIDALPFDAR